MLVQDIIERIKSLVTYFAFSSWGYKGSFTLGLLDPLTAIIISFAFMILLLYKRVNLGIVLNVTALLVALLALDWVQIPAVIYTTTDPHTFDGVLAISVVIATFSIMLLSQLYKETGMINELSESMGKIVDNPKAVLSVLPAVIGFLPVSGGALMSAPIVDIEAEKLKLTQDRKAYVNLWFRHTIFPVYPISQPLVVTAAMTGVAMPLIIMRQIPVVVVMVVIGWIIGFWKVSKWKSENKPLTENSKMSYSKAFVKAFSPILAAITCAIVLDMFGAGFRLSQQGFDVLIATLAGVLALLVVSRTNFSVFAKPFRSWGIYGITLAAYGAFLLRETMDAAGIRNIFAPLISSGGIDLILLLIIAPAVFGLLTGSPQGGIAISVAILSGLIVFTPEVAAMIYISAYLGYTIAPTHLCLTFTASYFKCSLGKMYKYVIPSFIVTFMTALLIFFLF